MKLRIAGIVRDSIVDGPGIRLTVFTQGCFHNCKGCHNPQTHSPDGGYDIDTEEILDMLKSDPLADGVTFSGGEPFLQTAPLTDMAKKVNAMGLNVIAYSGYVWEDIIKDKNMFDLAKELYLLIDGPFVEEKKSLLLNFRGSSNQRIIDVKQTLEKGDVVLWDQGRLSEN